MKVAMIIEDRDLGYLILDRESVPEGEACDVELKFVGTTLQEVLVAMAVPFEKRTPDATGFRSVEDVLFGQKDTDNECSTIEIYKPGSEFDKTFDFDDPNAAVPIPECPILFDWDEYQQQTPHPTPLSVDEG